LPLRWIGAPAPRAKRRPLPHRRVRAGAEILFPPHTLNHPKLMNTSSLRLPFMLRAALSAVALWTLPLRARATLFVGSTDTGSVGTYTNSGAPINPSLISGLGFVGDIAIAGDRVYVLSSPGINQPIKVGVYKTSGEPINASLFSLELDVSPSAIAVSGSNIFIGTDENHGTVRQYSTAGALLNPALITDLQPSFDHPFFGDMVISGGNLFVASWGSDNGLTYLSTVGEYNLDGVPVDADLITFRQGIATALAVSDSTILVRNSTNVEMPGIDSIAHYTTSGALVDPSFITGLTDPSGIAISGNDFFVAGGAIIGGVVGRYTLSGEPIDPTLITGLGFPSIAVSGPSSGVPESLLTLWLALPLAGLFAGARLRRRTERTIS
jgi:hypothetical protein